MKPIIQKLWMFIAALCASLSVSAWDFESDGLYYNILSEEDRTVEVKDYNPNDLSKNIEIPRRVIHNSKTYTVTSIGGDAFWNCRSLTSVTIPSTVTFIKAYAFSGCSSLTSVTIPSSVTYIGDYAFEDCSSLTSVTIPNSVTSIGGYAFNRCSSLTSVTIPNSVTSIGGYAFSRCSSLDNINVDSGNAKYSSIDGILYNKDATSLICCPGANTSATIPNSVTEIGEGAFNGCSSLTAVTIPNSVTSIGDYAFYFCTRLTSVTIPNSVTEIGERAFNGCSSLTAVTIPNSVTSIGDYAFYFCTRLTSVTIPNSVTEIGEGAFGGCNDLKTLYVQCEIPIECDPKFSDYSLKKAVLYVPAGTMAEYEKVDPWRNFWNIEEMDFSGIDGIEADEYGTPNISVNDGILTIDGIGTHESITVYDMQGHIIYNGTSHTIDKLTPGLYIVKAGSRSIKVSI